MTTPTEHNLGQSVKVYGRKPRNRIYFVVLLLAGSLFLCSGCFAVFEGEQLGSFLFPVGLIFLIIALVVLYLDRQNRDNAVQLFTRGLLYKKAGKVQSVQWDDIEAIYQEISMTTLGYGLGQTFYKFILELCDRTQLKFSDDIKEIEELGHRVQEAVSWKLRPVLQDKLAKGEKVEFGPYALSSEAIYYKDEPIPWESVNKLQVSNHAVLVKAEGRRFKLTSVRTPKIPNPYLFIELCLGYIQSEEPIEYVSAEYKLM